MSKLSREEILALVNEISDSTYDELLDNIEGDYIDRTSEQICQISSRAAAIAAVKLLYHLGMVE